MNFKWADSIASEKYRLIEAFEDLRKCKKFKKLFIKVSNLKMELDFDGLGELLKELDDPYYYMKFGTQEIVYLRDMLSVERTLPYNRRNKEEKAR